VFAIGDVHGRADLLGPLLEFIETCSDRVVIVFLGDLVDRGPDSRKAVELALEAVERHPGSVIVMGNHEDFLFDVVTEQDPWDFWDCWKYEGGKSTVKSFGIEPTMHASDIAAAMKKEPLVRRLFDTVVDAAEDEDRIYVHAGIRPHVPLAGQREFDLRWIRELFLDSRADHGRTVVHGHTITRFEMPEVRSNRIALDTGAFATGKLTAAWFAVDGSTTFLMASDEEGPVKVSPVEPVMAG
jgi:serine/threonine protein phosphatase 1